MNIGAIYCKSICQDLSSRKNFYECLKGQKQSISSNSEKKSSDKNVETKETNKLSDKNVEIKKEKTLSNKSTGEAKNIQYAASTFHIYA